jgi:LmbE family N-acetylglucosaminyl deacetylase
VKFPQRIKWSHIRRLYELLEPHLKSSPVKLDSPDRGRVLVLSPHIDDEVIGSGGSLRKHVLAGDEVAVIYFADCTPERMREAREAGDILGLRRLEFWEYGPKTLRNHPEISERLAKVLDEYKPGIVYLPSLFDRHNDHLALNHFFSSLYEKTGYDLTVYAYEVWTTLVPNLIIDISDVMEEKRNALAMFRSQLSANDWLDAAVSLNRYRGVTSGAGLYAEGFIRYSMGKYYRLWKEVYGR